MLIGCGSATTHPARARPEPGFCSVAHVLRRVQLELRRINKLQTAAAKPLAYSTHMTAILKLTKSDHDAHSIYQRVANQYPSAVMLTNGYLFTPHNINT